MVEAESRCTAGYKGDFASRIRHEVQRSKSCTMNGDKRNMKPKTLLGDNFDISRSCDFDTSNGEGPTTFKLRKEAGTIRRSFVINQVRKFSFVVVFFDIFDNFEIRVAVPPQEVGYYGGLNFIFLTSMFLLLIHNFYVSHFIGMINFRSYKLSRFHLLLGFSRKLVPAKSYFSGTYRSP